MLLGRSLISLTFTSDINIKLKARNCIGVHQNRMKDIMVHFSVTVQPQSIRCFYLSLRCINLMHGLLTSVDVTYSLLSHWKGIYTSRILSQKFSYPLKIAWRSWNNFISLYDSGYFRHEKIEIHHHLQLEMTPSKLDPELYFKKMNGRLRGMSGA